MKATVNWTKHLMLLLRNLLGISVVFASGIALLQAMAGEDLKPTAAKDQAPECTKPALLQKALISAVETTQKDLNNRVRQADGTVISQKSKYRFKDVQAKGRHLFTAPFTEADGAGEGRRDAKGTGSLGLRETEVNSNLRLLQGKFNLPDADYPKLLDVLKPPFAQLNCRNEVRFSILRMNGLDSQSCFECHNSIGEKHPAGDPIPEALERKQGTTGGPAGQASNAFINDSFPNPVMKFVRNPPHVFGIGYVQKLAETMTEELLARKAAAYFGVAEAARNGMDHPEVSMVLQFSDPKGRPLVNFGALKVQYIGDPKKVPDESTLLKELLIDPQKDLTKDFREEQAEVQGVSHDLVVRPFQWKGIASNERNFVRSAMMFHFGMMPRELNPGYTTPKEDHDPDHDGHLNEVSEGNVSALSIFTMSIRPPGRDIPDNKKAIVAHGEKLFRGEADGKTPALGKENSCSKCHIPALPLYDTIVCVRDPFEEAKLHGPPTFTNITSLVARQQSSKNLPGYRKTFERLNRSMQNRKALKGNPGEAMKKTPAEIAAHKLQELLQHPTKDCVETGYAFDLNMEKGSEFEALSFSYPRLSTGVDADHRKMVPVPFFSDLKRHDMGEGLADKFDQPTDVETIKVERRLFLTRPLWGVADTGPWLHDGRARTLQDAILLHEGLGSEANPVIEAFKNLNCDDQTAIVEFLLTLRLPLDCRYEPCFDQPTSCGPPAKMDKKSEASPP